MDLIENQHVGSLTPGGGNPSERLARQQEAELQGRLEEDKLLEAQLEADLRAQDKARIDNQRRLDDAMLDKADREREELMKQGLEERTAHRQRVTKIKADMIASRQPKTLQHRLAAEVGDELYKYLPDSRAAPQEYAKVEPAGSLPYNSLNFALPAIPAVDSLETISTPQEAMDRCNDVIRKMAIGYPMRDIFGRADTDHTEKELFLRAIQTMDTAERQAYSIYLARTAELPDIDMDDALPDPPRGASYAKHIATFANGLREIYEEPKIDVPQAYRWIKTNPGMIPLLTAMDKINKTRRLLVDGIENVDSRVHAEYLILKEQAAHYAKYAQELAAVSTAVSKVNADFVTMRIQRMNELAKSHPRIKEKIIDVKGAERRGFTARSVSRIGAVRERTGSRIDRSSSSGAAQDKEEKERALDSLNMANEAFHRAKRLRSGAPAQKDSTGRARDSYQDEGDVAQPAPTPW